MMVTNKAGNTKEVGGISNLASPSTSAGNLASGVRAGHSVAPISSAEMQRTEMINRASSSVTGRYDYEKELLLKFPGAQIKVSDLSDPQALRRYAQKHFGSLQIILSPETVKRMETDTDFRKQCEELIAKTRKSLYDQAARLTKSGRQVLGAGMFIDEDGNVSQWTASQEKKPPNAGSQNNQMNQNNPIYNPWLPATSTSKTKDGTISRFQGKDGKKYIIKSNPSYRPAKDLSRLAQARNQQMVKTTISSIRGSIYQLKSGSGDKKVTRQLVNQAEQVLLKAQMKIKHLKKEELLEIAQKNAEKQSEIERAMHLKRMLEEKRVRRTVREYSQIHDYYPTPQEIKREEERAKEWVEQVTGVSVGSTITTGMQTYASSGVTSIASDMASTAGSSAVFIDITL